jgi:hypothetical protein
MEDSRSGSDEPLYVLREDVLRSAFAEPVGLIVKGREGLASAVKGNIFLVSVGDIVTLDLLESGIVPDLSIVDFSTRRMPIGEVKSRYSAFPQEEVRVANPPAVITRPLWDAIQDGFMRPRRLRIVVDGEEDLASLACISLAPDGTTIVYGIPGVGATVLSVDDELRTLVRKALDAMRP